MKIGAWLIVISYGVILILFGWWGVLASALHIGSLFLFGARR